MSKGCGGCIVLSHNESIMTKQKFEKNLQKKAQKKAEKLKNMNCD
jgi:hypothetical protein